MDNTEKKAFRRWMYTASDRELQQKVLALTQIYPRLKEPDVRADCRWLKWKMVGEIDARNQSRG